MDRGAWWAAVHGVTQSWTRLKRLSSSSSSIPLVEENAIHIVSSEKEETIWETDGETVSDLTE